MDSTAFPSLPGTPETPGSPNIMPVEPTIQEHGEGLPTEPLPKLKGRQRLLQGLQRISSSPSLSPMGRRRAQSNPYGGRSTISCVSLAAAGPSGASHGYGQSVSSQSSNTGYSTAPTSFPGTPGQDTPVFEGSRLAIRPVSRGYRTTGHCTPTSVPLPQDVRPASRCGPTSLLSHAETPEMFDDYFSRPIVSTKSRAKKTPFDFWGQMPHEIKLAIFRFLQPKELVRASIVSKMFYRTAFDGQLWTCFDASEFYTDIPAESLAKIIVAAGPFVKDLNLRGCVQVEHYKRAEVVVKACMNLINATLEGCRNFQRSTLHHLLTSNQRLAHLNLTGLTAVNNGTCKIIAKSCPQLEVFNVSWCTHMDYRGIRSILAGCPRLRDLRAGEVRGFSNLDVAQDLFKINKLERLVLSGCADLDDMALQTIIHGIDPEIDVLEDRPIVPPRRLRHLDISRCTRLTSQGVKALAHNVPHLQGLRLSGCTALTDTALESILATTPRLSHLDLEELSELTNSLLSQHLAKAPCASHLQHLSISYCENLGDTGMLPVIRACTSLSSVDMDNTRISDLVLAEASQMVRTRSKRTANATARPHMSLHLVVYDCQNVTWTGIREVLSWNASILSPFAYNYGETPADAAQMYKMRSSNNVNCMTYPTEVVGLKCFYGWQQTVDEHMKRVLKGGFAGAGRLERKWAEWMVASEEAGAGGAGNRRRRRRAREAAAMHADEEEGGVGVVGVGRRRRARSGGCALM